MTSSAKQAACGTLLAVVLLSSGLVPQAQSQTSRKPAGSDAGLEKMRSGAESQHEIFMLLLLLRQFALLGFVVIGLITLVLSVMVSSVLRRDLLDREWVITADYVRTQILALLKPRDLAMSDTDEAQSRFEQFSQQVVRMPEVFRVKVYAADGTVIWSDDAPLIGRRFSDNPHLTGALAGRAVVNMESGAGKTENSGERSVFARVVEVYVPIVFPGASRVAGVVEVYKMSRQVLESIQRDTKTASLSAHAEKSV